MADERNRADVMGAAAFLRKPVSLTDLQHAPDQIAASSTPQESPVRPQNGTVLVVDDSEVTLRFVADLLFAQGYAVVTARNAQEALSILDTLRPVLILMDIQMPGMDGLEAIGTSDSAPMWRCLPHGSLHLGAGARWRPRTLPCVRR
ncbi:MAG: response regulator [Anaerolineales bacterium]|nr:response regulator [Anaerolineales bacterium]